MKKRQFLSNDPDETMRLAEVVGRRLRGGETIELVSDLGGGKTTFVRGLARGLGSGDPVRSPSFTIANEYHAKDLTLHHLDFYRLSEPGIMRDELAEILGDDKAALAVEWGGIVNNILPARRLTIRFSATGPETRELNFEFPVELEYLMENT